MTRCWSSAPAASARASPPATGRSARESRRPASGQGSSSPATTSPARARRITVPFRDAPALERVTRSTDDAANPSAGAAASTATGLARTRAGRSGASARPGARTSTASESHAACAPSAARSDSRATSRAAPAANGRLPTRGATLPSIVISPMARLTRSTVALLVAALAASAALPAVASAQHGNGLYEPFPEAAVRERAKRFVERLPLPAAVRLGDEQLERGVFVDPRLGSLSPRSRIGACRGGRRQRLCPVSSDAGGPAAPRGRRAPGYGGLAPETPCGGGLGAPSRAPWRSCSAWAR